MDHISSLPKHIEVETQAEYVAVNYLYDFLLSIDGCFADWPGLTELTPQTKEFLHQVERAFSLLSVYVYQILARGSKYEKTPVRELEKWPESYAVTFLGETKHWWEGELRPEPCWLRYRKRKKEKV